MAIDSGVAARRHALFGRRHHLCCCFGSTCSARLRRPGRITYGAALDWTRLASILEGRARNHWGRRDRRKVGGGTQYPGEELLGVPVIVRGQWTREGASTPITGPWNLPAERPWQRVRQ